MGSQVANHIPVAQCVCSFMSVEQACGGFPPAEPCIVNFCSHSSGQACLPGTKNNESAFAPLTWLPFDVHMVVLFVASNAIASTSIE